MKQFLLLFVVSLTLVLHANAEGTANVTYKDIIYQLNDNNTATVVGLAVNKDTISKVVVVETVEHNGQHYLVTTLVDGNEMLQNGAFSKCKSLTSVVLPNTITSLGACSFYDCKKLQKINIPTKLVTIGNHCFDYCVSLDDVVLPSTLKTIGYGAFSNCSKLSNIENRSAEISSSCMDDVFSNTSWEKEHPTYGMKYLGSIAYKFYGLIQSDTTIILKEGITQIADQCFKNNSMIVKVVLPSTLQAISASAFCNCINLEIDALPSHLMKVGENAFYNCSKLNVVNMPVSLMNVGSNAFSGTKWLSNQSDGMVYINSIAYVYKGRMLENTNFVLKEGTTILNDNAFEGQNKMVEIQLPSTLLEMRAMCLANCDGINALNIPKSVVYYDYSAISGCSNLSKLFFNSKTVPTTNHWEGGALPSYVSDYRQVDINVPEGTENAYKELPGFIFGNVVPSKFVGISSAKVSNVVKSVLKGVTVSQTKNIQVISFDGKLVFSGKLMSGETLPLTSGVYILHDGNESQKLIVK